MIMKSNAIINHSPVKIGFVPSHIGLAKAHIPDDQGNLARSPQGSLILLDGIEQTCKQAPVAIDVIQVMTFPGVVDKDLDELINGIKNLGIEPQLILMIGGVNPMDALDEDAAVELLLAPLKVAKRHGIRNVGSTSAEAWMDTPAPKNKEEYRERVAQIVQLHHRVYQEANLEESCIESWSLEYLRPGEMNTFTSISKIQPVVSVLNKRIGKSFFKILVDAAHCGDGEMSVEENAECIRQLAESGELSVFHASVHTTRGCLSSDNGWIAPLLKVFAEVGCLEYAIVEVFKHTDPILEPLRKYDANHGVDTTYGRAYTDIVIHNLVNLTHQLNYLNAIKLFDGARATTVASKGVTC